MISAGNTLRSLQLIQAALIKKISQKWVSVVTLFHLRQLCLIKIDDLQISQMEATIAQKEGEIQRLNRHLTRVGKDVKSSTNVDSEFNDSSSELARVSGFMDYREITKWELKNSTRPDIKAYFINHMKGKVVL